MKKITFNTPLMSSIAALSIAFIVLVAQLPALVAAVLTPSLEGDPTGERLVEYLERHHEDVAVYTARFNGRSLFFKPKAPPPPPKARVVDRTREEEPPPPLPPSGPPKSYPGPSILFVLGDEVWFHTGLRLSVGEEQDGVKVISSDPPWTVRLGHSGGEYDIELFRRRHPGLDEDAPASGSRKGYPGLKIVEETAKRQ